MSIYTLMRLFTIRFRMLSAIGVVLVLMAVIGGVGMFGMLRLHDLSGHFITHSFAQAGQLGQLRSALGNVRAHEKDMLLAQGQPEALAQAQTAWAAALDDAKKTLGLLATAPVDGVAASAAATGDIARSVATRLDSYRSQFAEVAQRLQAPAPAAPAAPVPAFVATEDAADAAADAALAVPDLVPTPVPVPVPVPVPNPAPLPRPSSDKASAELVAAQQLVQQLDAALQKTAVLAGQEQGEVATQMQWWFVLAVLLTIAVVAPLTHVEHGLHLSPAAAGAAHGTRHCRGRFVAAD